MTRSRQTADWGSRAGLAKIVPSSVAVGSGTGSATALGTVSFSGASSVSLNDVFNATYDNYLIRFNISAISTGASTSFRFRVSGSDNSSTQYKWDGFYNRWNGGVAANYTGGITLTYFDMHYLSTYGRAINEINLFSPYLNEYTLGTNAVVSHDGEQYTVRNGWHYDATTSFTGFSAYRSAGTMTGTVSVYGYTI